MGRLLGPWVLERWAVCLHAGRPPFTVPACVHASSLTAAYAPVAAAAAARFFARTASSCAISLASSSSSVSAETSTAAAPLAGVTSRPLARWTIRSTCGGGTQRREGARRKEEGEEPVRSRPRRTHARLGQRLWEAEFACVTPRA